MSTLVYDVRHGVRRLMGRPWTSALAVLCLALGIGANSAVFSLVDELFLKPFAVSQPGRLVWITADPSAGNGNVVSFANLLDLRKGADAFTAIAPESDRGTLLSAGGEDAPQIAAVITDDYFPLLGVAPLLGRAPNALLDALLPSPAVVISYGLWQRKFGGDPAIVSKQITLRRQPATVIGVMPRSFKGLRRQVTTQVWMPAATWAALTHSQAELTDRADAKFVAVARLRDGVTLAQARAQIQTIAAGLRSGYPAANRELRLTASSLDEPESVPLAGLLLAAVGLVLLIACANVAMLLIGQSEARRQEIAIRVAVGASRSRLVCQLITEGALLSILGAAVGLVLASWLMDVIQALLPPWGRSLEGGGYLDQRPLIFTLVITAISPLVFALVPALRLVRSDALPRGTFGGGSSRWPVARILVVVEIALAFVLLNTAGLLGRSLLRTQRTPLGFTTDSNLLLIDSSPAGNDVDAEYRSIADRLRGMPGVRQATYARRAMLSGSGGGATRAVTVPGIPIPEGQSGIPLKFNQVAPNYFAVMQTRIVAGRAFAGSDSASTLRVAIVSEAMARRFWSGQDPVGRSFRTGKTEWQVVGVAEDTRINAVHEAVEPFLYFPVAQMPDGELTLIVETHGDPARLAEAVRREIRVVSPGFFVYRTTTLRQHMEDALYWDRMPATLAVALTFLGVAMAAVGLFGMMWHSVVRQRREIGVRFALGADRRSILVGVLRDVATVAFAGSALGVAGAIGAGGWLSSMLYGINPRDPWTLLASAAVVWLVSMAAAQLPAMQAARVDPAVVLRGE